MPDTLHNVLTAMPTPQVKTWDDLAQAACAAYNKAAVQHDEEGLACHALSWAELDPGGQACWLAVVHQLWAEYVALRALTHRQFHLPDAPAQEDSLAIVAWGNHPKAAL